MNLHRSAILFFIRGLPSMRFYSLKAKLLKISGINIDPTARVVSSIKISGNIDVKIAADRFVGGAAAAPTFLHLS